MFPDKNGHNLARVGKKRLRHVPPADWNAPSLFSYGVLDRRYLGGVQRADEVRQRVDGSFRPPRSCGLIEGLELWRRGATGHHGERDVETL